MATYLNYTMCGAERQEDGVWWLLAGNLVVSGKPVIEQGQAVAANSGFGVKRPGRRPYIMGNMLSIWKSPTKW